MTDKNLKAIKSAPVRSLPLPCVAVPGLFFTLTVVRSTCGEGFHSCRKTPQGGGRMIRRGSAQGISRYEQGISVRSHLNTKY